MKYGDTLSQRSPQEWEACKQFVQRRRPRYTNGIDNIDYNDIKRLIKDHTSRPRSAAIAIPGSTHSEPAKTFENELYEELASQHQRIDLFVRSKTGETQRRLDHLEKVALHLQNQAQVVGQNKLSVKRLEKFSKLENEVMRAGDQIQTLARYICAQQLAFKKLLKKYRKWSGSTQLDERFAQGIVNKPKSFEKQNLEPLLLQYTELLTAIRAPFETGFTWNVDKEYRPSEPTLNASESSQVDARTAGNLQRIFENGTNLEVDAALAALPFGSKAGHISYWVPPENLLQLHVLLLQYSRLKVGNSVGSTPRVASGQTTPRGSVDASAYMRFSTHETNGIVLCDDLKSFARGRSGVTIDQLEAGNGLHVEAAAASIRYAPSGECLILVFPDTSSYAEACSSCTSMPSKFKSKVLRPLFEDSKDPAEEMSRRDSRGEERFLGEDPVRVRTWLQEHRNIQPLVHIKYKRSRFVGLGNSTTQGVWATLDGGIQMKRASLDDLGSQDETGEYGEFPHALLEVRWEGRDIPEIVQLLNESHLVERVPGFSLEVHAVASLCKPVEMLQPHWMSTLQRDIRKIPNNSKPPGRGTSQIASDNSGDQRPSTGTASAADVQSSGGFSKTAVSSPATSIPDRGHVPPLKKAGRKHRARRSPPIAHAAYSSPPKRYWNEFEDGEEAPGNDAFTVFVDPNTPTPFVDGLSKLKAHGSKVLGHLRKMFAPNKSLSGENEPLLRDDYFSIPRVEEGVDGQTSVGSDTSSSTPPQRPSLPSRYSVFPSYHSISSPLDPLSVHNNNVQRDQRLGRFAVVAFLSSLVLLIASGVTRLYWRNGTSIAADIMVVLGLVGSVLCAVGGVGLMAKRDRDAGWLGTAQVGLVFAVLCVGNGVLVVHLAAG